MPSVSPQPVDYLIRIQIAREKNLSYPWPLNIFAVTPAMESVSGAHRFPFRGLPFPRGGEVFPVSDPPNLLAMSLPANRRAAKFDSLPSTQFPAELNVPEQRALLHDRIRRRKMEALYIYPRESPAILFFFRFQLDRRFPPCAQFGIPQKLEMPHPIHIPHRRRRILP